MSEHWALQQVKIRNTLPLEEAQKKYKNITKKKARKVRDTKNFYVFRHIPPTKFEKKSFRTKVVNDDVQMVFVKLKEGQEFSKLNNLLSTGIDVKYVITKADSKNNNEPTNIQNSLL